ncbi:hypothetical protein [Hymenobacter ruricola]|uniref:Uncharacterized protein n=1 Tax=Hymenobacter ruricola TaxID=2791023 RepID=A0ABS0I9J1_9BACT|nr:hypothetical protein [Hymenobacter ruricola]MBF9223605.1 hypothetical protein [Hymenobacter ruricola]
MYDAICYVLANDRLADTVLQVLERYLSYHNPITEDYEDFGVDYTSEYDMLRYFQEHPDLAVTRYWNGPQAIGGGHPHISPNHALLDSSAPKIMAGAHFLADGHLVISLTIESNDEAEDLMLVELKQFLQSSTGLISYVDYSNFLSFDSAAEFKAICDSL